MRWRYIVTSSLIGWVHTQNDPCYSDAYIISRQNSNWNSKFKFKFWITPLSSPTEQTDKYTDDQKFGYQLLTAWTVLKIIKDIEFYLSSGPYTQSIIRFFFLVYQADVSIFYTSNLYWWGKGWPVDGLPFPDTGCPVPDVSIYYMSNINELPDGILFHWFCKCTPPWMFLPLDIPSEYRPEHVTFGLLCVIFKFPSRIFCRRVPGFATDCPCGVWCRGLTTCLLYVGPPLEF